MSSPPPAVLFPWRPRASALSKRSASWEESAPGGLAGDSICSSAPAQPVAALAAAGAASGLPSSSPGLPLVVVARGPLEADVTWVQVPSPPLPLPWAALAGGLPETLKGRDSVR